MKTSQATVMLTALLVAAMLLVDVAPAVASDPDLSNGQLVAPTRKLLEEAFTCWIQNR